MAKRTATKQLNYDNWNEEDDESEDPGTFQTATADEIQKRIIRKAKRKNNTTEDKTDKTDGKKNIFSNFTGFTKPAISSTSPFATLTHTTNSNGVNATVSSTSTETTNILSKSTENLDKKDEKSSKYLTKLQGLNESVSKWIASNVEKNPFCILTPIFDDYKKYLNEIENEKKVDENISSSSTETTTKPSFDSVFSNLGKKPAVQEQKQSSFPSFFNSNLTPAFNFGNTSSFTFPNVQANKPEEKSEEKGDKSDEEPPKVEVKQVSEEGSIFSKRCKVFVKNDTFTERGVGQLFLKPVEGNKTQLIVRQETTTGSLLLNIILSKSVPIQRNGKNNVMLVCVPDEKSKPPPVPVLLRVKTAEDADELLSVLEKNKK